MAKLINGDGNPAIYAAEDSDWFASIMGNQTSITGVGSQFAATITDANTVTVADGVIITKEGRRIQLDVNMDDSFTIPAGQQDVTNYYIIGYHLVSDDLSVQTAEKFVQLMDSASATIPEDTFRGGADDVYVSLYRVTQVGLSLTSLQALLPKITNVHGTEAMLATVQNSNKASRTFNKGEYIQLNNTYYKITATVASGATFTEGVNISATNIGDELTQINSDLTYEVRNLSSFVAPDWTGSYLIVKLDKVNGIAYLNGWLNGNSATQQLPIEYQNIGLPLPVGPTSFIGYVDEGTPYIPRIYHSGNRFFMYMPNGMGHVYSFNTCYRYQIL